MHFRLFRICKALLATVLSSLFTVLLLFSPLALVLSTRCRYTLLEVLSCFTYFFGFLTLEIYFWHFFYFDTNGPASNTWTQEFLGSAFTKCARIMFPLFKSWPVNHFQRFVVHRLFQFLHNFRYNVFQWSSVYYRVVSTCSISSWVPVSWLVRLLHLRITHTHIAIKKIQIHNWGKQTIMLYLYFKITTD